MTQPDKIKRSGDLGNMTDKEFKIEKERIRKLIKKWVRTLGLAWWKIDFIYDRESKSEENATYAPKTVNGTWVCVMDTTCDPYYLNATVTGYLPETKKLDDAELEKTFLHELMHIFVSPMHSKKTAKEEELVATQLAQAFIWVTEEKIKKKEVKK